MSSRLVSIVIEISMFCLFLYICTCIGFFCAHRCCLYGFVLAAPGILRQGTTAVVNVMLHKSIGPLTVNSTLTTATDDIILTSTQKTKQKSMY